MLPGSKFTGGLRDPAHAAYNHLVFSKGHASPVSCALFRAAGAIDDEELITCRRVGSRRDTVKISAKHIAGALEEFARTPRCEPDTASE